VSTILLLDGVMIIIYYRLSTITGSLFLSIWSQFAMQASTCCIPRIQEHISYRNPSAVIANFLSKFSNFRYHGNTGWCETNFTYTVKFAVPENPLVGAISGDVSSIQAELYEILCLMTTIVDMATAVGLR